MQLPSLDDEASWPSNMVIPKLFDLRSEDTEPISGLFIALFDEVRNKYNLTDVIVVLIYIICNSFELFFFRCNQLLKTRYKKF